MVSRLLLLTSPGRLTLPLQRPVQARFHFGSVPEVLNLANKSNSQVHYAKGTPSHNQCAPTACRQTVSGTVSLLYSRCFSPFPHGTGSLSVSREYLALRDGPRGFRQDFSCPALLRILLSLAVKSCTGLSPPMIQLSRRFHFNSFVPSCSPTTPSLPQQGWFGLLRVRSPLLAQSLLFSFPAGTEMFQFPAFASHRWDDTPSAYRVAPFGYPGVKRLFAPNPGFSQLITSFIASESQGIHRLPLFTCLLPCSWSFLKLLKNLKSLKKTSDEQNQFCFFVALLVLVCCQYVKDRFSVES